MSDERTNEAARQAPAPESGPTPDTTPAAKEELATDVSEVARARRSDTDKSGAGGSIGADAADAAEGVAGTPADDDTAGKVEDAPTAVLGKNHPGPKARGEAGPDAPTPTPPAGSDGAPPPKTATGGGSQAAPAGTQPAGTGAATRSPTPSSAKTPATPAEGAPSGPPAGSAPAASDRPARPEAASPAAGLTGTPTRQAPDAPAARPGNGAARAADPDHTATGPTARDAAPTSAARASEASGQAATDVTSPPGGAARPAGARPASPGAPGAPKTAAEPGRPAPAKPAGAAAGASKPAGAARPAGAAGARPPGAAKPGAKPAAPPKPPEPDPAEVTSLREIVPDLTWERRHGYLEVRVPSAQLVSVARKVKGLGYDYLSAVTAVDWRDRVEMLYHCYGWDYVNVPGCVVLRADLPPEANPLCPSLTTVWAGAELQEREIYDLFGVKFVGHPDLRRVLLEDRFPGHPLRKDWTFDYEYVLVKHLKYGAEGQHAPPGGEEGFRRV